MARFLAVDWEPEALHIALASTSRKGARVERVLTWPLPQELTAATGEKIGRALRESLKTAGIAAAPVLVSIGRDRVILKEIRHPPVPPAEEPALVRFQTAKELSESPDDVVIDYTSLSDPRLPGEREAMAVVVRKEILRSIQALCRGAGLKLVAVTPRQAAVAGALARARPEEEGGIAAVCSLGARWAEFVLMRGPVVLLARALPVGANLPGEIRRTLAVFAAQKNAQPRVIFLSSGGADTALLQNLHETLSVPVRQLDPFTADDVAVPASERSTYLAAVGLLHLWATTNKLTINLIAPKEPKPPSDSRKTVAILLGVAAAVLVVFVGLYAFLLLKGKRSQVAELAAARSDVEEQLKALLPDRFDIDGLKEWDQTTIPWLDELYDLSARFPSKVGLRINELMATSAAKKNVKDKYVARLSLRVIGDPKDDELLAGFVDALKSDPHVRVTMPRSQGTGEFQIFIDLSKQPASQYMTRLVAPPRQRPPNGEVPEPDTDEGGPP